MRRLRRPNIVPKTLREDGSGGKRHAQNVRAWAEGQPDKIKVDVGHWSHPDVRGALHAMQGFACAYCQRLLDGQRGEVDHFRPKASSKGVGHGGYWWLAYSFGNYFLACRSCNGPLCKRDRFPLEDSQAQAKPLDDASLALERPLLLDPVADPVDTWMCVEWRNDARTGYVVVGKHIEHESTVHRRVTFSMDLFRLNKDEIGLRRDRILRIGAVTDAIYEEKKAEAQRLACRYLPHGAVGYQLVRELKPAWLPNPRDELLIFLSKLAEDIRTTLDSLRNFPGDKHNEDILDELLWTIAILWKDPPPNSLTIHEVSTWLDEHLPDQKAAIAVFYDAL